MPVVGGGADDGVDIVARDDFAVVVVGCAVAVAVRVIHALLARFAPRGVDVGDGHDLDFRHLQEVRQVRAVHHLADADRTKHDLVVGRRVVVVAQYMARYDRWCCARRRHTGQETSSRKRKAAVSHELLLSNG